MKIHLYLSLNPEALIASHLAPEEFGAYLAVGTQKYSRGQAMFFEVDPDVHLLLVEAGAPELDARTAAGDGVDAEARDAAPAGIRA